MTSPQAFEGLRLAGRRVRRPELTFATLDHNVPTDNQLDIRDPLSRRQVETLRANCREFGITLYDINSGRQGIVHVIGPELGLTLPGTTIVCGDSHTSTHGAFGALAFGIGTSEVEHVLATQTLWQGAAAPVAGDRGDRPASPPGLEPKDIILAVIRAIGTGGGTGHVIEYYGPAISALSMEGRMTICNMSIEAGARAGPDRARRHHVRVPRPGRPPVRPQGRGTRGGHRRLEDACAPTTPRRSTAMSRIDASSLVPQVTWGTNPAMTVDVTGRVPDLTEMPAEAREDARRALDYMGLKPGTPIERDPRRRRLHRLVHQRPDRGPAVGGPGLQGTQGRPGRPGPVVPGSEQVRHQAEAEGLDRIFTEAGAEWRQAGCSMCLAMNPDKLQPGQRAASTSNRNFEGRQGPGGRTHLVSPSMAAAAAVTGHFTDVRNLLELAVR